MEIQWESEAELALRAVSSAEELLPVEFSKAESVETKESRRDVVTHFDLLIEEHLRKVLGPSGLTIIGEENFSSGDAIPSGDQPYWVIDPLDGTANFVSGIPFYAISVGLCRTRQGKADKFLTGAVALPAAKELFFRQGDQSAFLNGKRLTASDQSLGSALIGAAFSGSRGDPEMRRKEYELFGDMNESSRGCLRLGSAASNICFAACGRLGAAYGFGNKIWDVAAALSIAKRAGCELVYHRAPGSPRVDYIVGAPSAVEQIRELCRRLGLNVWSD